MGSNQTKRTKETDGMTNNDLRSALQAALREVLWKKRASGLNDDAVARAGADDLLEAIAPLLDVARTLVMSVTPFSSAWEFDGMRATVNGEELHDRLRELLGITEEEWRDSDQR